MVLLPASLMQVPNWGQIADICAWAMFSVLFVIISLRLYTRAYILRPKNGGGLYMDDYITAFCFLVFGVTCVLVTVAHSYGLGKRAADIVPPEDRVQALKWNVISSAVLIWTFSLPKFAVITTLKRILDLGRRTTYTFWVLAVTSQALILLVSIWWFAQCSPIEHQWDRSVPGWCAPVKVFSDIGYFVSAYSAFLDFFFGLYPIPFIMRLNIPLKTRVTVSAALSLGVLACIVSLYKLFIFGEIFEIASVEPTYPIPFLNILGLAEGTILLICASVPTLGPLYRLARGRLTEKYGSGSTRQSRGDKLKASGSRSEPGPGGGGRQLNSSKELNMDDLERGRDDDDDARMTRPDSIGGGASDDIPLVRTTDGRNKRSSTVIIKGAGGFRGLGGISVHKMVQVRVTSDDLASPRDQRMGIAL